jgi:hypothetical protein
MPIAVSFCPGCLTPVSLRGLSQAASWSHCSSNWVVSGALSCPNAQCGRVFEFAGQASCPFCRATFDDGVPLSPRLPGKSLLDRISSSREQQYEAQRARAEREFRAIYQSWRSDSNSDEQQQVDDGTQIGSNFRAAIQRHTRLLFDFRNDLEKFLYAAPIRLSKHESEYSWKLDEALRGEIDHLLAGVLNGRQSTPQSLGSVVRSFGDSPIYSQKFLSVEVRRMFYKRREAPRPGFQLTLEYVRSLDGNAFEEWLGRLLTDAGVPGVFKTQASRDQGADIVVTIGSRKAVLQAKQYSDAFVGNKAVQEAFTAMHYYDASEAWVVTTSGYSRDAIDLASRTGVRLIDGSQLLNLPQLLFPEGKLKPVQPESLIGSATCANHISVQQSFPSSTSEQIGTVQPISQNPSRSIVCELIDGNRAQIKSTPKRQFWRDWRVLAVAAGLLTFLAVAIMILSGPRVDPPPKNVGVENEIRSLLASYLSAQHALNAPLLAQYYAPTVETFFLRHNVSQSDVLNEFQHSFPKFSEVRSMTISNLAFSDVSATGATAIFDKQWDLAGPRNFAGAERERMIFQKIDGNWRIVSEQELKVYWTRH